MFSGQFLDLFKSDYFSNYSFKDNTIEVQSKNTGHWWRITKVYLPISDMYKVYHRYNATDKYHVQIHVHTPNKAYRVIKDHDKYILK